MSQFKSQAELALAYTAQQIAKMHGLDPEVITGGHMFTIAPANQQKLESKLMMFDPFLSKITNEMRPELSGAKISLGIAETVSRRSARRGPRKPVDRLKMAQSDYSMEYVERDVEIGWRKLDAWSGRFPEFFRRFMNLCNQRRAQDVLITGWHGQYVAPLTDPETHKFLQDMQIGWIKYMIDVAPEKVLGLKPDGTVDKIRVGDGGDYANMHELVHHMGEKYVDPIHVDRTDISVVVGRELIADRKGKIYAQWGGAEAPTEQVVRGEALSQTDYAERPIQRSAFAPPRLVFLSPLDNFSRYTQAGTARAKAAYDDHDTKAIKDLLYLYESFQMEDVDACACVHPDAIQLKDKTGNWVDLVPARQWAVEIPVTPSVPFAPSAMTEPAP